MPRYSYADTLLLYFQNFAQEIDPKTNKRKRSDKSINAVYKYRIEEFIEKELSKEENWRITPMEITVEHINSFLATVGGDYKMYSLILKSFFRYTYEQGNTKDITIGMKIPKQESKPMQFITEEHCQMIADFIADIKNNFDDRLLVALFYYTGLELNRLCKLTITSLWEECLWIPDKNNLRQRIPIHSQLLELLLENENRMKQNKFAGPDSKIVDYADNTSVTTRIKTLSKKITQKDYSPKSYEKTFKRRALKINCNPYLVAKLTMSRTETVAQYIDDELSIDEQKKLVEQMK